MSLRGSLSHELTSPCIFLIYTDVQPSLLRTSAQASLHRNHWPQEQRVFSMPSSGVGSVSVSVSVSVAPHKTELLVVVPTRCPDPTLLLLLLVKGWNDGLRRRICSRVSECTARRVSDHSSLQFPLECGTLGSSLFPVLSPHLTIMKQLPLYNITL